MTLAYYNEFDPFCADWLLELIADGLIAPGIVDRRSIVDVLPSDLKGFTQCHFFAGIAVWSLSLRLAGFPDDRPIWTGSCPCQPFSAAGKGAGFDDERHLWPHWQYLIERAKPPHVPVVGEQVASKDGRTWLDLVFNDMEGLGHACGALDTCAAGLGAPFIGQRLYWLAATDDARLEGHRRSGRVDAEAGRQVAAGHCATAGTHDGMGAPDSTGLQQGREGSEATRYGCSADAAGGADRLASTSSMGSGDRPEVGAASGDNQSGTEQWQRVRYEFVDGSDDQRATHQRSEHGSGIPLHPVDYWRDAEWLLCRDPNGPRFRPVESSSLIMADVGSVGGALATGSGARQTHFPLTEKNTYVNRLNEIRGAGNALNVAQASTFIECVMEYLAE